jgi:hypothetical protein
LDRKEIEKLLHSTVYETLENLFEEKHLYQYVKICTKLIKQKIAEVKTFDLPTDLAPTATLNVARTENTKADLEWYLNQLISSPWQFDTESHPLGMPLAKLGDKNSPLPCFRIPTIRIACHFCDGVLRAHNSGFLGENQLVYRVTVGNNEEKVCQIFTFPFQCQNCKGEPIFYLIRREGLKFQITGRSHFPEVDIPKFIPKKEKEFDHFRNAIICHTANQPLAALFLLRVFIEQYMRRVTQITEKVICDSLADSYSLWLPENFPSQFNSFKRVYDELSRRIHAADPSAEQFDQSRKDIENHFEQLKLLPLRSAPRVSSAQTSST